MADRVECRSDHTYAQRPRAIHWQGERLVVKIIEAEWQTPHAKHFRVRTTDLQIFELAYHAQKDQWGIHQP